MRKPRGTADGEREREGHINPSESRNFALCGGFRLSGEYLPLRSHYRLIYDERTRLNIYRVREGYIYNLPRGIYRIYIYIIHIFIDTINVFIYAPDLEKPIKEERRADKLPAFSYLLELSRSRSNNSGVVFIKFPFEFI